MLKLYALILTLLILLLEDSTVEAYSQLPTEVQFKYKSFQQFGYVSSNDEWIKYEIDQSQCVFKYTYIISVDYQNLNYFYSFYIQYKYKEKTSDEKLFITIDGIDIPFEESIESRGSLLFKKKVSASFQYFIKNKQTKMEITLLSTSISFQSCFSSKQQKLDYSSGYLSSFTLNKMINQLCPLNQFSEDIQKCSNCDITLNRILKSNYCECNIGFFQNGNQLDCEKCNESCKTCNYKKKMCTTCFENAYLDSSNQCVCEDGYFMNKQMKCQKCSPNCITCKQEEHMCTSCADQINMQMPNCKCPNGMYLNLKENQCQQCSEKCQTCQDNPDQCLTCATGYLIAPSCSIRQCTENEEYDPVENKCIELKCNNKCDQCVGEASNCTVCRGDRKDPPFCVCDQFKYDDQKSEFCLTCPEGEYMDQSEEIWQCKKCHFSCKRCTGPLIQDCIDCYEPQFVLTDKGQCECKEKLDLVNDTFNKIPKCVEMMKMSLSIYINESFQQIFRLKFTQKLKEQVTKQILTNNLKVNLEKVKEDNYSINYLLYNYDYIEFTIFSKVVLPIQKVSVYITNQYEIVGDKDTLISRWYLYEPVEVMMLQDLQDLSSKQENLLKLKQASESVQNNAFVQFVTNYYFFLFILKTLQPTILFLLIATQLPIQLELFLKIVGQFVFNKNKFFAWYQLTLEQEDSSYHIFLSDVTDDISSSKPSIYQIEQLGLMENFLYNTQIPILIITLLCLAYWILMFIDKFNLTKLVTPKETFQTNYKSWIQEEVSKSQWSFNRKSDLFPINVNGMRINSIYKPSQKVKMSTSNFSTQLKIQNQIQSSNETQINNENTKQSEINNNKSQIDTKLQQAKQFLQNTILSNMESNFIIFLISMALQFNNMDQSNFVNRISAYFCLFFLSQFIYFHVRSLYLMKKGRLDEIPTFTSELKSDKKYYFHFYSFIGKIIILISILLNRYNQILFISIISAVQLSLLIYIVVVRPFKTKLFLIFKIIGTLSYFLSWFCLLLYQIKRNQLKSEGSEFYQDDDVKYLDNLGLGLSVLLFIFNGIYLIYALVQFAITFFQFFKTIISKKQINIAISYIPALPFITTNNEQINIELVSKNNLQEELINQEGMSTTIDMQDERTTPTQQKEEKPKIQSSNHLNVQQLLIKFRSTSVLGIPIQLNQQKYK